ncbi:hypothetical protein [Yinghuangia soli]|uniref:Uncharacterized protein n=1 Tax=Yinghuangia soli TaxID=2908204 RepID=A0AA41Q6E0_9ACTN|nr:hypothetical protein [Yinghuangia soli]MCF2532414.1 hypothetical protein [Yinghuangia soli]
MRDERGKLHDTGPGTGPATGSADSGRGPGPATGRTAAGPPREAADDSPWDARREPGTEHETRRETKHGPEHGPGHDTKHDTGHGTKHDTLPEGVPGGAAPQLRGLPDESSAERLAREDHPLLEPGDAKGYRTAWQSIQSDFVDRPKDAVREADALVAEVMGTLAASFATHKDALEAHWAKGDDVVTEDLRVALQRYRSFFNRLLNA